MSWELDEDEQRMILALPAKERYSYLLQLLADTEEAWGLRNDEGWVVGSDPERGDVLPLWPHSTFAEACARGKWADGRPAEILLDDLLDELLPLLEEDRITIAAFPTPDSEGHRVSPQELGRDLRAEIELGEGDESQNDLEDDLP